MRASFLRTDTVLRGPLKPLRSIRYGRTLVRFPLYVTTLIRQLQRCDVIHVFAASFWSFVLNPTPAIVLGKLFRKRVVVNYHSGEALEHLSHSRTAVRTLRRADAIVVQFPFLEEIFDRSGLATTVIPNHLDPMSLPFRARRPLRPMFLSTRALEPSYGVATVLEAFGVIQQRRPDATLRIVGDGSSRAELERLARQLRLRGVTFSGMIDTAEMAGAYDAADVFLNASTVDSMPLSILEAFACGLPVVTTDAGGIPWLVEDEVTGLLVPPDDPVQVGRRCDSPPRRRRARRRDRCLRSCQVLGVFVGLDSPRLAGRVWPRWVSCAQA